MQTLVIDAGQPTALTNGFPSLRKDILSFEQMFLETVLLGWQPRDGNVTFDIEAAADRFAEFVDLEQHVVVTQQGERVLLTTEAIAQLTNVPLSLVEVWMRTLLASTSGILSLRSVSPRECEI